MSQESIIDLLSKHGLPENSCFELYSKIYHILSQDDLGPISDKHGSDRNSNHKYSQHYHKIFSRLRYEPITLLELGIGGYNHSSGGAGLRMWKEYFPNGMCYGIDIEDKKSCDEDRIKTFRGSQDDSVFITEVLGEIGQPDIIIDDASHINPLTRRSFEILFPHLKTGGYYAIEDLQTSYWFDTIGVQWLGSSNLDAKHTTMALIKRLCDGLNHEEFIEKSYKPSYTDQHIKAVHLWHNLCVIEKNINNEGSILGNKK